MRNRKGWLSLLLGLALVFSLAGCRPAAETTAEPTAELTLVSPSVSPTEETQVPAVPETAAPTETADPSEAADPKGNTESLEEDGSYDSKEDVALYLQIYGELPDNYITKDEARQMGWNGGSVERYAPGMCIGGDRFGNQEGLLPQANGRVWTECDIDTLGGNSRGAKRIVYSNDGLIYYTDDHYESFQRIYPEE